MALLGAFLIPILLSSLQGLTHILTCQQATNVPFTVQLPEHGQATISSSAVITREQANGLCGGLRVGGFNPTKVTFAIVPNVHATFFVQPVLPHNSKP